MADSRTVTYKNVDEYETVPPFVRKEDDTGETRKWYKAVGCCFNPPCGRANFNKWDCKSYTSRRNCFLKLVRHMVRSGNHNMTEKEAMKILHAEAERKLEALSVDEEAQALAMYADEVAEMTLVEEYEETAEEREQYRLQLERQQRPQKKQAAKPQTIGADSPAINAMERVQVSDVKKILASLEQGAASSSRLRSPPQVLALSASAAFGSISVRRHDVRMIIDSLAAAEARARTTLVSLTNSAMQLKADIEVYKEARTFLENLDGA